MKTYKAQRYLFFWLSAAFYFMPYIIATACLLPFMEESTGMKWSIGLVVALVNALPFIGGVFRVLFSHTPFINMYAIIFMFLAAFFTLPIFSIFVYTFLVIEGCAALGSIMATVFWFLHRKYKTKAETVHTVLKSGVLETRK